MTYQEQVLADLKKKARRGNKIARIQLFNAEPEKQDQRIDRWRLNISAMQLTATGQWTW